MKDAELFVQTELADQLAPGETILRAAYFETASGGGFAGASRRRGYWCALTEQRIWLITSRVGAFGVLQENHGVRAIERASIIAVREDRGAMSLGLMGGETLDLVGRRVLLHAEHPAAFGQALAASHRGPASAPPPADTAKRFLGLVVTLAALVFCAYSVFYGDRAEVKVECFPAQDTIECTVSHEAGGAAVTACWAVEVRCENGRRARAVPDCTEVESDEVRSVDVPLDSFHNIGVCDEAVALEISNLHTDDGQRG